MDGAQKCVEDTVRTVASSLTSAISEVQAASERNTENLGTLEARIAELTFVSLLH